MKIACLQFAPALGEFEANIAKASAILENTPELRAKDGRALWLVLPELAFSGYNFSDYSAIKDYLEPTSAGPTTKWAAKTARALDAYVTVGYPETTGELTADGSTINYNSIVTVAPSGDVVINYRKSFLYYTDTAWAQEGDTGFWSGELAEFGMVSQGICMDINPYQFIADWDAYEFANHVLDTKSQLVIVSMAWIVDQTQEQLHSSPLELHHPTLNYWLERLSPVQRKCEQPVVVVMANRCGQEDGTTYAGSSAVLCFNNSNGYIFDYLGKAEERCMVVDLQKKPKHKLHRDTGMGTGITE